jgi:hypothetical protein
MKWYQTQRFNMKRDDTEKIVTITGIDISHSRLVELTKLADQAKPFYDWVELRFQKYLSRKESLDKIMQTASKDEIRSAILDCYSSKNEDNLPLLFDGIGRIYPHIKACYYIFSWIIRDAPKQRLEPLINRIISNSRRNRIDVETDVLSALIIKYRKNVKTFAWQAIREIIIDRLEGSRRSIRGHEKESIVRVALLTAIQTFFEGNGNYGIYAKVELPDKQIKIGSDTFDVSADLINNQGKCEKRIFVCIKTRETEGGGHSHLFTRDIESAMKSVKNDNDNIFLIAVVVARNWSENETKSILSQVDHAVIFNISPNDFTEFNEEEQVRLNYFISSVLKGKISPK